MKSGIVSPHGDSVAGWVGRLSHVTDQRIIIPIGLQEVHINVLTCIARRPISIVTCFSVTYNSMSAQPATDISCILSPYISKWQAKINKNS